jgi:hypothetical protein
MIYAFLIHSAENVGAVYFSHFYTGEGNDELKTSRQQAIVRKVVEDKSFQQHAASCFPTRLDIRAVSSAAVNDLTTAKKVSETFSTSSASVPVMANPTGGIVLLNSPGISQNNLAAVWKQFGDTLFTTVCDRTSNLPLVASTCVLLIEHLARQFGINKLGKSILEQPDEVEAIIAPYLGIGSPLVVNHSLHRFMIKSEEGFRPFLD